MPLLISCFFPETLGVSFGRDVAVGCDEDNAVPGRAGTSDVGMMLKSRSDCCKGISFRAGIVLSFSWKNAVGISMSVFVREDVRIGRNHFSLSQERKERPVFASSGRVSREGQIGRKKKIASN